MARVSLDALEAFCEREGKSWDAAQRMVRTFIDGVSPEEAALTVLKLLQPREVPVTDGSQTVQNALVALDARRKEVAARLEGIDREKAALKSEEKQLNQAATALRKVTGAKNEMFNCDICEMPFASRQGLATHTTRVHKPRAVVA